MAIKPWKMNTDFVKELQNASSKSSQAPYASRFSQDLNYTHHMFFNLQKNTACGFICMILHW